AGDHAQGQEDTLRGAAIRRAGRAGQAGQAGGTGPGTARGRLLGGVRRTGRDEEGAAVNVLIRNGRNLNRLGKREPHIYGETTYDDLVDYCRSTAAGLGLQVDVRQTNHEGDMVEWLHEAADNQWPVILNGAAWTHYSIALRDACAQLTAP